MMGVFLWFTHFFVDITYDFSSRSRDRQHLAISLHLLQERRRCIFGAVCRYAWHRWYSDILHGNGFGPIFFLWSHGRLEM